MILSFNIGSFVGVDVMVSSCDATELGMMLQSKLSAILDVPDADTSAASDCRIRVGNVAFTADAKGTSLISLDLQSGAYLNDKCAFANLETCNTSMVTKSADSELCNRMIVASSRKRQPLTLLLDFIGKESKASELDVPTTAGGLIVHSQRDIRALPLFSSSAAGNNQIAVKLHIHMKSPVDSVTSNAMKVVKVGSFTCSIAVSIMIASPGETKEQLIDNASSVCLTNPHLLGFSISQIPGAEGSNSSVAMLFSNSGYPPKPSSSSEMFIKVKDTSLISDNFSVSTAPIVSYKKSYCYLGGGHHGDTNYFDSSSFLDDLIDETGTWSHSVGKLNKIHIWAGDAIVNGLQFVFSNGREQGVDICSPLMTSDHDRPVLRSFTIDPCDRIVSISVRFGSLVHLISFIFCHILYYVVTLS